MTVSFRHGLYVNIWKWCFDFFLMDATGIWRRELSNTWENGVELSRCKGKVLLIVNVASQWLKSLLVISRFFKVFPSFSVCFHTWYPWSGLTDSNKLGSPKLSMAKKKKKKREGNLHTPVAYLHSWSIICTMVCHAERSRGPRGIVGRIISHETERCLWILYEFNYSKERSE